MEGQRSPADPTPHGSPAYPDVPWAPIDHSSAGRPFPSAAYRGEPAWAGDNAPATITPAQRLTALFEVIVCSPFVTQVVIGILLMAIGLTVTEADGYLSLRYVVWLSLIDTVAITVLAIALLRARDESPRAVFLGGRDPLREIVVGVLLVPASFALIMAAALVIQGVAPMLRNPEGNPLADLLRSPLQAALFALVTMIAGGLREELQRAFILHRFDQYLGGGLLGLVLFSVTFGLGHRVQGWDATIMTGLLGVMWGAVYLRRRSVVGPAVCHALFNLIEVVYHGSQA
jgi:membrane protease YdiL (CAAX protease family)